MQQLSPEIQEIIKKYEHFLPQEVALKLAGKDLPVRFILEQIEGRQKAKDKLPSWYNSKGIIFPPKLNLEQSSSEITADYKVKLVNGKTMTDLTGGLGVDSSCFSKYFEKVFYVEQNTGLAEIVQHNFSQLKIENVEFRVESAEAFINHTLAEKKKLDLIYIDPARRDLHNKKVFHLSDCEPDVIALMPKLAQISNSVLIKTSPMLDIDLAIKELGNVTEVHIISVDNECKEVLYLVKPFLAASTETVIKALNVYTKKTKIEALEFTRSEERDINVSYSNPLKYLYESNTSVLKAGAFKLPVSRFQVFKLAPNTHLYTSADYVEMFPGKAFEIKDVYKYKDKTLQGVKANLVTRNFPYSIEEIKKTMKIKDGGDQYIYAVKDQEDKPILILAQKFTG